uniref:Uncharacterized protein n=1 Tax=Anguilla anguilla TaxID=7936 RepID=A0A0E9V5T1_ANGAN
MWSRFHSPFKSDLFCK